MKKTTLYTLAALLGAHSAWAQDLSTSVVVDRSVVPEEKAAERPASLSPVLTLPGVEMPSLVPGRYTTLSPLTRSYSRLDPAAGALAAIPSATRGYVALGYFPTANGTASAGYRIAARPKFTLDAAVQADLQRYKPQKRDPRYFSHFDIRGGFNGSWTPSDGSRLGFDASYELLNQHTPLWEMQSINYVSAAAAWESTPTADLSYTVAASAGFEMPGNTIIHTEAFNPAKDILFFQPYQQRITFDASATYGFTPSSKASLKLGADIVHSCNCVQTNELLARGGTAGYITATPSYILSSGKLWASVGIRLDLGTGGLSGGKFRVAPDINLQWGATDAIAIWARIDGGESILSNHDLRQLSPYQIFIHEAKNSNVPIRATAGINITPARGLTVGIGGGYAKAKHWMMISHTVPAFRPFDITGWNVNALISYTHRYFAASAKGTYSPGDRNHAWLDNRDRARIVAEADLKVFPVAPLTIGVGFRGRFDRRCYTSASAKYSLGDVADLNASASWRFNDRLTVFGRCENILGHTYLLMPYIVSDKQTGAVGIEFKF